MSCVLTFYNGTFRGSSHSVLAAWYWLYHDRNVSLWFYKNPSLIIEIQSKRKSNHFAEKIFPWYSRRENDHFFSNLCETGFKVAPFYRFSVSHMKDEMFSVICEILSRYNIHQEINDLLFQKHVPNSNWNQWKFPFFSQMWDGETFSNLCVKVNISQENIWRN